MGEGGRGRGRGRGMVAWGGGGMVEGGGNIIRVMRGEGLKKWRKGRHILSPAMTTTEI